MTSLKIGSELTDIGFRLASDVGAGTVGRRWRVQPCESEPGRPVITKLAEVVDVSDESLESLCDNISMLVGSEFISGIGNVIATQWTDDKTFAAIFDIDAEAKNGAPRISPAEFWQTADSMLSAFKKFHSRELVHAALNPSCLYAIEGQLIIGDLWWCHREDGEPLAAQFANAYRNTLPEQALAFAAPEILSGGKPSRLSDIYSLGKIWHHLLSEQPLDEQIRGMLEGMTHKDPQSRFDVFTVEAMVKSNTETEDDGRRFRLSNELFHGGTLIPPEVAFEITDLYRFGDAVQVQIKGTEHNQWLTLEAVVAQNGAKYIALSHDPDFDDRDGNSQVVALRIEDNQLYTLTSDELDSIYYALHIGIQKQNALDKRHVESLIGRIRDWQ